MYRQIFTQLIIILTIASALLGCETVEQTQRGNYSATTYNLNHTSNQRNINAGQRVALIIGNANYAKKEQLLINPVNDADDMAKVLPNFGFKVLLHKDVDNKAMREAIAEFGRQSNNAEAALFFYAGHGVQSNNRNYLIPVTANILNEASLEYETVNLNFVLDTLDQAGSKANLVFLDACRNNPYSGVFRSSRGGAMRGLAPPSGVPSGTMIVYATDPGKSASDGEGRNGLLTAGMLEALQGRDLSLGGVLAIASKKVVALSNNEQIPYVNGPETLRTDFYFRSPQLAANTPPVTVPIVTPTVTPPLPNNDRLTELQQQRIAEEARVADLIKQRQEAEEKLRLEEARKKREAEEARVAELTKKRQEAEEKLRLEEARKKREAEEARVVDLERQRQRKELEEANRLAEVRRQREAEEARLAELTSQRKEAQQQGQDFEPANSSESEGDLVKAGFALEREIRIEPRNPHLWQKLARIRLQQGLFNQAQSMAAKSNTVAGGSTQLIQENQRIISEAIRLAEVQQQRKEEEARLSELTSQRKEAQQLISGRYQDNGDGTVTDVTTNLMWKRCSEGQTWTGSTCAGEAIEMTWVKAMPNERQKSWDSFAGYSDWRIPTDKELKTLVYCSSGKPKTWNNIIDYNVYNGCEGEYQLPTIDLTAFSNAPATKFLTASLADSSYSRIVYVHYGSVYYGDRYDYYAVRLVHAGQRGRAG